MQFTKIALAAAVTLVAAQAQAATVYLAGASATSANYRSALQALCTAAGGSNTVYTNTSDSNKFAVKCSTNFSGIAGVDAVSFNVSGGSFTAISTSVGTDTVQFPDVAAANPNTALTAARSSEGGFLDIDAAAFPADVLSAAGLSAAPATFTAAFSQVFGVAVSPDLYTALQTAQGITANVDAVDAASQSTISKAQYTSIVSAAPNTAKTNINAILGVGVEGDKLTVCRRVSSSGTQAASNQYFLNSFVGGDGVAAGALLVAGLPDYSFENTGLTSFEVNEGAGTGNARTCLSNPGYAVGVLSLENAFDLTTRSGGQRADRKWRFVKINGVAAYDGVNNIASAQAGTYDFWFTSQKFGATTNGTNVVNAIDAQLGSVNLPGLFGNTLPASKAQRTSNTSPIFFN